MGEEESSTGVCGGLGGPVVTTVRVKVPRGLQLSAPLPLSLRVPPRSTFRGFDTSLPGVSYEDLACLVPVTFRYFLQRVV